MENSIKMIAEIPAEIIPRVTRVTEGLLTKAGWGEEDILKALVKLFDHPKAAAKRKNKLTKLARLLVKESDNGISIKLTKAGQALLEQTISEFPVKTQRELDSSKFELKPEILDFPVYGGEYIEEGAFNQMNVAMQLPIAIGGALMPDAHQGYGLPIGGVLATEPDKVIPYAVGVDIACRMCMSVFDLPSSVLQKESDMLKTLLGKNAQFGIGGEIRHKYDASIMDKAEWNATKVINDLKDKAYKQLGTSGTGNHFVEWGVLEIEEFDEAIGLPMGQYLTLLSHSGSRGFGGTIASYYTRIARQVTKLPGEASHLAWLDLNKEEGQEYWIAMNLAGEYASANHHEIHNKMASDLNLKPILMVENHHNFAWREKYMGKDVLVHRKGATPASKDELGIIPGSMATPGFLVKGLGNEASINSASHGAGRVMSRTAAFKNVDESEVRKILRDQGIELIGSDLDEAPMVYKNIHEVIDAQTELVKPIASFHPRIVRMADARRKEPRED